MTPILVRFRQVLLGDLEENTRPNRIGCISVNAEAFLVLAVRQGGMVCQGCFACHEAFVPQPYTITCKRETERLVVFTARS